MTQDQTALVANPEDLLKMAEFVEEAQKISQLNEQLRDQLQKTAMEKSAYDRFVPMAVENMADNGIIDYHQKEAMARTLMESPVAAIKLLVKLARRVGPVELGHSSDRQNLSVIDEFTRFIMG